MDDTETLHIAHCVYVTCLTASLTIGIMCQFQFSYIRCQLYEAAMWASTARTATDLPAHTGRDQSIQQKRALEKWNSTYYVQREVCTRDSEWYGWGVRQKYALFWCINVLSVPTSPKSARDHPTLGALTGKSYGHQHRSTGAVKQK